MGGSFRYSQATIGRVYVLDEYGRHEETRTPDLYRVKLKRVCNPLILGASVAPKSILEHPKNTFSTLGSTLETQKVEVGASAPSEARPDHS